MPRQLRSLREALPALVADLRLDLPISVPGGITATLEGLLFPFSPSLFVKVSTIVDRRLLGRRVRVVRVVQVATGRDLLWHLLLTLGG